MAFMRDLLAFSIAAAPVMLLRGYQTTMPESFGFRERLPCAR
jgi:hypothetical protein